MNPKRLFCILGLGALTVALTAVPGSSAHKQNPTHPAPPDGFVVQGDPESLMTELASLSDDGDVQVLIDSGPGWLGVGVSEVTASKVKDLKLPAERGVVLGKIVPDSPAAKAGLKQNDVITEIDGQRIEGTEQFRRMIREIPSGRAVPFAVWRDGRSQTVSVTIGKSEPHHNTSFVSPGMFAFHMPDMPQVNDLMEGAPWFAGRPRLGIDAEDLDGDFGDFFGAPDGQGVLVRGVFTDSAAAKAGLKVGDVITSVDADRVHSVGELREKLVEKHSEKSVKLGLIRNKAPLTLSVEMPAPAEHREHHNSVRTNI